MGVIEQETKELCDHSMHSRDSVGAVVYEDFTCKFCLNYKNKHVRPKLGMYSSTRDFDKNR